MEKLTNCRKCGKELGRRQRYYCSNDCKLTDPQNIKDRTPKKEKQDQSKKIKCLHTGKTFKDIKNYSGVLTRHIESLKLKGVEIKDNLFENFEIIDNPNYNDPKYHCKYCDWVSKDTKNVSGWITLHIIREHRVEIKDHVKNYPEEASIFNYNRKKELKEEFLDKNPTSVIICKECGERMRKITVSHLKTHGMTPDDYRKKYFVDILSSNDTIDKCRKLYFEKWDKINVIKKSSSKENELKKFIENLGIKVEYNNRTILFPNEVDIYLPDHKIAIEYHGLAWHSEFFGKKPKKYHLNKLEKCENQGVQLIQIFEDEWIYKKDLVKEKIKNIIGVNDKSIYARKCVVKEIDTDEKGLFLDKYHIQGNDKSNIKLGLYFEGELISVMTFSHPRMLMGFKSYLPGEYELSRFCSKYRVIGGASKLFKYFVDNYFPIKVFSYADRRWSTTLKTSMYEKIGFKLKHINPPTYWYTKNHRSRYHRFTFSKKVIIEKLGGDPNLTEIENMRLLKYDRIWDCGNIKYEWSK